MIDVSDGILRLPPEGILAVFEEKLLKAPTPELTDAYIRLRQALGRDGDFQAMQNRLEALEKRVVSCENAVGNKRVSLSPTGVRLG